VLALVQEEMLVAKDEEAVFRWIVRWSEASERPEAELMAVLNHVRFATMEEGFLRDTVRAWPALLSAEGQGVLHASLASVVGGVQPLPRLGFGPRRIYLVGGRVPSEEEGGEPTSSVRAYCFDPALDTWCEVSSMAAARQSHGAAALGGKLYVMGGEHREGGMTLAEAEVYDPKADSWQPLPSMPTARKNLAAAVVAGKVYAIGGFDHNFVPYNVVEAYDPISGAWTLVANLPVARGALTATVFEGKIYVLGGDTTGGEITDRVDVYDPAADSWSWQQTAAMPSSTSYHSAAVLDGTIYMTGALSGITGESMDAFAAYDPVASTWTILPSLNLSRADHASAVIKGKLYLFGGETALEGMSDLVEVYCPASSSWASAAGIPSPINESVAVAL